MPDAQRIVIRIKKGKDGRASLTCTRADGTVTWQVQERKQAAFFPRHDLTHCAVETVLELPQGFYGLVAAGWDFSDFGTPWPRGKLPPEASASEAIVGFFDIERRTGEAQTAPELNRKIAEYCAEQGLPPRRELTDEDLDLVRQRRAELFAKWDAVQPGDALEIPFEIQPLQPSAPKSKTMVERQAQASLIGHSRNSYPRCGVVFANFREGQAPIPSRNGAAARV